ncbi:ElaB/YqjD/DUF883 family membrane-anchored ribosome-binding protein [Pseudomonas duriflava]|uniref:ElaB/YqjD/DUF883 family membrane-anchored ribosome-binding protein n=1 Tax=Pseudomonas duriflava TaxID=459528 RepID=A0A562QLJ6_9PSED|nr:DUF883 family protein [Pseudomonas duriflava]TWI57632.1 ElaB/YqjD/DUF883 family membrane-anchored ribosome-binding protein [Pseudomonas duriflava]
MARNSSYQATIENIQDQIQALSDSLSSLKRSAGVESRHSLKAFKDGTSHALHRSGETLEDVYDEARVLALEASKAASSCARKHPWATVGVVVGLTALAGWWLLRDE